MKLLIFSIGPIFEDVVHGGSQKVLIDIAKGLGEKGWVVDILSPPREGMTDAFSLSQNVTVLPVIPLKGSFPTPYGVSPFRLMTVQKNLEKYLPNYDLFYIHDGSLLIENVKNVIPTVTSLRDFCYQETLLGAMNFKEKYLIVNSNHTYDCLLDSFGQINPSIKNKTRLVYNGYSYEKIHKVRPSETVLSLLGLSEEDLNKLRLIGFPHRPDLDKGFLEALELMSKLKEKDESLRLCIPMYMDTGVSSRADSTYSIVSEFIQKKGLEKFVIFHPWIPHDLINEYYSLCSMVLCIGTFVESFSNVSVESLMCETPVLATNVATYRSMPIREYLSIADHGNSEQLFDMAVNILNGGMKEKTIAGRDYIIENLNMDTMINNYQQIFEAAVDGIEDTNEYKEDSLENGYRLASWCVAIGNRIYNDYVNDFVSDDLDAMIFRKKQYWTREELLEAGINEKIIDEAVNEGTLILC